jgi:hypothetical protein
VSHVAAAEPPREQSADKEPERVFPDSNGKADKSKASRDAIDQPAGGNGSKPQRCGIVLGGKEEMLRAWIKASIRLLTTRIETAGPFTPSRPKQTLCPVLMRTLWLGFDAESECTPTCPGEEASYEARKFMWLGPRPCLDSAKLVFGSGPPRPLSLTGCVQ